MAPLTWRNVDAPDLSAAANMMARVSDGIQRAFKAGGDIGRGIYKDQVDIGSREAMNAAAKISDSEGWQKALKDGTAYGNMDPRFINQDTLAWGMSREKDLLAMENARAAEARAAEAHSLRMTQAASGGGSGGGGGGGRRSGGGGGGTSKSSSDADKWAVTEAQGALRLAIAEFGEGSEEANAAAARLAGVSAQTESKGGYLDAVDAVGAGITAEKAAADQAGKDAVAALGDDPYAEAYSPAFEIPGATIPGVSDAISAGSTTAASPAASLPVPNATAPGGPVTAPVVETEIPPSPAAAIPGGFNLGTPVDAPASIDAPAPEQTVPVSPRLSFGNAVAAADTGPVNADRPLSWSQYAQERLAEEPQAASVAEAVSSGSNLDPVGLGFSPEVAERPEWQAFTNQVSEFQDYFGKRNQELVANRERGYDDLTAPRDVKTAIDSSRVILEETLKANPEFALYDNIPKLKGLQAEGGPEAVANQVIQTLGIKKEDQDGILDEIISFAGDNGVDIPTAASAIIASGGPRERNLGTFWDMNNLWQGNIYYDADAASALLEKARAVSNDPAGNISNRNAVGGVRSTLSGLESAYETSRKAVIAAEAAAAKRPNDARLQEAAETARARLLEVDKNIIEFTRLLPDQLAEMGMEGGPGRRATVPEIPEAVREADASIRARKEQEAGLIAEFGTANPTFQTRRGQFDVGDVAPNSPGGLRFAENYVMNMVQPTADQNDKKSFFDWVAKSPEASSIIFGRIQEMEYLGEDVDLPEEVEAAYSKFTETSVPDRAIQDFSSLGFDIAARPEVAAKVANNPEVIAAMQRWNNAQSFFTLPSTRERAEQAAKEAIRSALTANNMSARG